MSRGIQEPVLGRKIQVYLKHWQRVGFLYTLGNFEMKIIRPAKGHKQDPKESVKKGFHSFFIIIIIYIVTFHDWSEANSSAGEKHATVNFSSIDTAMKTTMTRLKC